MQLKRAVDEYRGRSGRQFPTWSEILEVLRSLGYAKRVWCPVALAACPVPEASALGRGFQALGEDSATGVLGWYSRVEITVGC